jgi:tRNA(Ile)-lysidine synthase
MNDSKSDVTFNPEIMIKGSYLKDETEHFNHPTRRFLPKILRHLSRFMDLHFLWPKDGHAYLAYSGGMDSNFLLFCLAELVKIGRLQSLSLIYCNHCLREDFLAEEKFVYSIAKKYRCFLYHTRFESLKNVSTNIEARARELRYKYFSSLPIAKEAIIYTAHHIDDSFEWSMMAQMRGSSLKSALGIPLNSKNIRRPLHCFTKAQIVTYCRRFNIQFYHDKSNDSLHHQRNYWRHKILPLIKRQNPHYLKHFVYRANDLASLLACHQSQIGHRDQGSLSPTMTKHFLFDANQVMEINFSVRNDQVFLAEYEILEILKQLSGERRGVWRSQLKKCLQAFLHQKKGPLLFSGQISAHLFRHSLILIKHAALPLVQQYLRQRWEHLDTQDESTGKRFMISHFDQLTKFLSSPSNQYFLIYSFQKKQMDKLLPGLKDKNHPLLGDLLNHLAQHSIWVRPAWDLWIAWAQNPQWQKRELQLFI